MKCLSIEIKKTLRGMAVIAKDRVEDDPRPDEHRDAEMEALTLLIDEIDSIPLCGGKVHRHFSHNRVVKKGRLWPYERFHRKEYYL